MNINKYKLEAVRISDIIANLSKAIDKFNNEDDKSDLLKAIKILNRLSVQFRTIDTKELMIDYKKELRNIRNILINLTSLKRDVNLVRVSSDKKEETIQNLFESFIENIRKDYSEENVIVDFQTDEDLSYEQGRLYLGITIDKEESCPIFIIFNFIPSDTEGLLNLNMYIDSLIVYRKLLFIFTEMMKDYDFNNKASNEVTDFIEVFDTIGDLQLAIRTYKNSMISYLVADIRRDFILYASETVNLYPIYYEALKKYILNIGDDDRISISKLGSDEENLKSMKYLEFIRKRLSELD